MSLILLVAAVLLFLLAALLDGGISQGDLVEFGLAAFAASFIFGAEVVKSRLAR